MKKALCFVLLVSLLLVSFTGCHREPERYKFMHNTTEITSIELVRLRDGENYVVCEIDDIDRFCADVGERWVYNSYVNPPPTPMLGELCLIVHYKNGDYQQIAYRLSCNMFHEPIDGKPGEEYYVRFDSEAEFYTMLYSHSASMFSDISKCENLVESGAMDEKLRLETLNTYDMPASDPFYTGAAYESFCGKEYCLSEPSSETIKTFFFYAYEFTDESGAQQYYTKVSGKTATTNSKNVFYGKLINPARKVICVLDGCKVYSVTTSDHNDYCHGSEFAFSFVIGALSKKGNLPDVEQQGAN